VCILTGAGFKDRHHDGVTTATAAPDVDIPMAEFDLEEIETQAWSLLIAGKEEQ